MNSIIKRKSPEYISFLSTFIVGFATHLFGFVNVIHNYDDIGVAPIGSGTGLTSGRWLLDILDTLFRKMGFTYNLPYVNAVLFFLLIALSVALIIRVLEIKNPVSAALIGAVFVVFPSATSTLFFKFASVLYGLAFFFAVLAVWCARRYSFGFLSAILLVAFSLGIYQAYVPLTISLMVIVLLKDTLARDSQGLSIIKQGLKFVVALIGGVIAYSLLLKFCLLVKNTQLSGYQGMDTMGALTLSQLPGLLKRTLSGFLSILSQDYLGVSQTSYVRFGILLLGCISAGLIVFILIARRKKRDCVVLTLLLCAVFPFAVNFIVIMCPSSYIYTLMAYSFASIFTVPFVLLENAAQLEFPGALFANCKKYLQKIAAAGLLMVILSYAYWANVNYMDLYYTTEKTKNYISSMVLQARMTEGFNTSMEWAFVGTHIQDPLIYERWFWVPKFGGNERMEALINSQSRTEWIRIYVGYNPTFVTGDRLAELEQNPQVADMPCFPNDSSIQIIDDVVVIKLQDTQ